MVVNHTAGHPCLTTLSFVIGLPIFCTVWLSSSLLHLRFATHRLLFPDKRRMHDHTDPDLTQGHSGTGILGILASVPGIRAFAFVFCPALEFFLIPFR